jgi:hypothetical protein
MSPSGLLFSFAKHTLSMFFADLVGKVRGNSFTSSANGACGRQLRHDP